MRAGFRKAAGEYRDPPEDGATDVPAAYMEMLDKNPVLLPACVREVAEDLGFGHLIHDVAT